MISTMKLRNTKLVCLNLHAQFARMYTIIITGKMEIIISQLIPPMKERLLRRVDPNFVKALKSNMIRDPTGTGVPPAVVFTNQVSLKEFNIGLKDAYKLV